MSRHLGSLLFWLGLVILITLALGGCGGGADAPPPTPCVPKPVVTIGIYGDSTNVGASTWGTPGSAYLVADTPGLVIQRAMDARFGAGAVVVATRAVSGTAVADLLAGASSPSGSYHAWPADAADDIELENYGINDSNRGTSAAAFADQLRTLYAARHVVFETEYPTVKAGDGLADVTRAVAIELDAPLIDVNAFVHTIPNWSTYVHDGTHPDTDGYRIVTQGVVVPALVPMVAALKCEP